MCISVCVPLKHFFISIDDERGDSFTKRIGRTAFMVTGLVLMILGTLTIASIYGSFTGIAVIGSLANIGVIGGYTITFIGLSLFIVGIIREVFARQHLKKIRDGLPMDSEIHWDNEQTRGPSYYSSSN